MALKKAARGGHLAEVLAAEREPAMTTTVVPGPVPAAPVAAPRAATVRKAAAPRPAKTPAAKTTVGEGTAYTRPDHSGTVSLGWKLPPGDALALRAAVADQYDAYADLMQATTGQDGWRLSVSGLIIGAWGYAEPHLTEWLPTCPGDGRATKVSTADYARVQASLPRALERTLQRTVRSRGLEFEAAGGKGLTLVGLVIGALRYALPHIDEWLATCPNDGRRVKPAKSDGRLKQNR